MKIRIQDYDLRLDDLLRFPAWEYALDEETVDGQDERTVRPYEVEPPLNPESAYFIVRATYVLADGTTMKGLVKPVELRKQGGLSTALPYDLHPTLVTNEWQMHFCYGTKKPSTTTQAENYRLLGKQADEVFPITIQSDIKVADRITEGTVEGFMYFDENTDDFFQVQTEDILVVK